MHCTASERNIQMDENWEEEIPATREDTLGFISLGKVHLYNFGCHLSHWDPADPDPVKPGGTEQ